MVARDHHQNTKTQSSAIRRGPGTRPKPAALPAKPVRKSSSLEIQAWFIRMGARGGTADECAGKLGLMHHAVSAALNRLRRSGALQITKERRITRSGHSAHVYVWAPHGKTTAVKPSPSIDQRILKVAKAFVAKRARVRNEKQYAKIVRTLIADLSRIALESV